MFKWILMGNVMLTESESDTSETEISDPDQEVMLSNVEHVSAVSHKIRPQKVLPADLTLKNINLKVQPGQVRPNPGCFPKTRALFRVSVVKQVLNS
jgi:hypothetical protein